MPAEGVRRRKSRDSGQSLLEFVFLLPILLLLAIGIVELGRAAAFTIAVNNAATAGVEYGSQNEAKAQDLVGMQTAATQRHQRWVFHFRDGNRHGGEWLPL